MINEDGFTGGLWSHTGGYEAGTKIFVGNLATSDSNHPAHVLVFAEKADLDFQNVQDVRPTFQTSLPVNRQGEAHARRRGDHIMYTDVHAA